MALLLLAYLLPILALAAPDEASGIVTNVVDGDTFDLRIEKTDPRIIYEIERVRLADVDSPEMSTPGGPPAKVFSTETLLGKRVWLDIDDRSKDGRDMYERILAVVHLEDLNGTINTTHPFNRLLVDAGFAVVKDFTNNEFDPATWWAVETTAGASAESMGNQRPSINSLDTNKASPQPAGESIIFTAKASDSDGDAIYYEFWQNGPATGGVWRIVRTWGVSNIWMKTTSSSDIGNNQFRVWVMDGQPGHADGSDFDDEKVIDFKITAPATTTSTGSSTSGTSSGFGSSTTTTTTSAYDGPFVGSINSDVYHYPWCASAKRIKSSNLITFSTSAEARAHGYRPCSKCHPP